MNSYIEEVTKPMVHVDTLQKYVLVSWTEIQLFMDHQRWSKCIFCTEIAEYPCLDNSYMVPEEIYEEIYG